MTNNVQTHLTVTFQLSRNQSNDLHVKHASMMKHHKNTSRLKAINYFQNISLMTGIFLELSTWP